MWWTWVRLAGSKGGEVVYEGDFAGLLTSGTLTGNHMKQAPADQGKGAQAEWRTQDQERQAQQSEKRHRLDSQGRADGGFGRRRLGQVIAHRGLPAARLSGTIVIDQELARGSRRSNTATYTGILDNVRKAFAKANAVDASLFSANSKGACPDCNGLGVIYTDLGHLDPMATTCETCEGKRFLPEVLEHRLRGKSISDVYEMSVADAVDFFTEPAIAAILHGLDDVGLGYLTLGQPLSTLSGGERQRLKLAAELGNKGNIYVLDEPTTSLHMNDVDTLIGLFDRLVDSGSTVIVIEHNLDVIAARRLGHRPGARRRARGRHGAVRGRAGRSREEREYADGTIPGQSPERALTRAEAHARWLGCGSKTIRRRPLFVASIGLNDHELAPRSPIVRSIPSPCKVRRRVTRVCGARIGVGADCLFERVGDGFAIKTDTAQLVRYEVHPVSSQCVEPFYVPDFPGRIVSAKVHAEDDQLS